MIVVVDLPGLNGSHHSTTARWQQRLARNRLGGDSLYWRSRRGGVT
jgi:hypothetical protein